MALIGMSAREVNAWLKYMDSVGWAFSNGAPVAWRNYRRPLRMWHLTERRIRIERNCADSTTEEASAKKLEELKSAAAKPESWGLCRERCAFAEACGCAKKHTIPPQLRPHLIPPEECADFAAREEVDVADAAEIASDSDCRRSRASRVGNNRESSAQPQERVSDREQDRLSPREAGSDDNPVLIATSAASAT